MSLPQALASRLRGKRLAIFDFDGTLVDSAPLHARAFAEVLAPLGVAVDYARIAGLRTDAAMRHALAAAGIAVDAARLEALVRAKQARGRALIAEELRALPAAAALLARLRGAVRLALVTSGSRATVRLALGRLGWDDWFDPFVCGDDVREAKPHPEGFRRALALAGVAAAEAIVFEDSPVGFAAAEAAGLAWIDARDLPRLMAQEASLGD